MSDHLDRPTGDSCLGVVALGALAIVIPIVLLMGADTPAPIVPDEPADMELIIVTTTTVPPATTTSTSVATTTSTSSTVTAAAVPATSGRDWDYLADCESGDHDVREDGSWNIHRGTARWSISDRLHQGGLQFAVSTWDAFAPAGYPADAHLASREQQIHVGELVLAEQGPRAWPTCGPMVGLR